MNTELSLILQFKKSDTGIECHPRGTHSNYQIRALRHIRGQLFDELACGIVMSTIDYCNALIYGGRRPYANSTSCSAVETTSENCLPESQSHRRQTSAQTTSLAPERRICCELAVVIYTSSPVLLLLNTWTVCYSVINSHAAWRYPTHLISHCGEPSHRQQDERSWSLYVLYGTVSVSLPADKTLSQFNWF